ncbi:hypothetical protein PUN28_006646 [Cardiocondyla obscurior]|uniref:Uncharacterized protein n=1 Tax=Cardiocondyla obscurior TaxID=286306 RepID=A0AAW2GBE3_9HYME
MLLTPFLGGTPRSSHPESSRLAGGERDQKYWFPPARAKGNGQARNRERIVIFKNFGQNLRAPDGRLVVSLSLGVSDAVNGEYDGMDRYRFSLGLTPEFSPRDDPGGSRIPANVYGVDVHELYKSLISTYAPVRLYAYRTIGALNGVPPGYRAKRSTAEATGET